MKLKINIWTLKFFIQIWKLLFKFKNLFDLKINIWILVIIFKSKSYFFNSKRLIKSKNWHFDFK
jgi:hypothetical protein